MPFNWIDKIKAKITGESAEPDSTFNAWRALMWIGASLLLAALGQYAFSQGLVLLAVLDMAVAAWIFVVNVRPFFSGIDGGKQDKPESPPETSETEALKTSHPEPQPQISESAGLAERWGFVKHHWRELTLHEIFTGTYAMKFADASISASTQSPAVVEKEPETTPASSQSAETLEEAEISDQKESAKKRREGQITRLTSGTKPFDQPKAVATTPNGDVLVLDVGQELVFRFDPDGELLGEWSVSGLDQLHAYDLTVSPDGETIYLIDKDDQSVYKISLS